MHLHLLIDSKMLFQMIERTLTKYAWSELIVLTVFDEATLVTDVTRLPEEPPYECLSLSDHLDKKLSTWSISFKRSYESANVYKPPKESAFRMTVSGEATAVVATDSHQEKVGLKYSPPTSIHCVGAYALNKINLPPETPYHRRLIRSPF